MGSISENFMGSLSNRGTSMNYQYIGERDREYRRAEMHVLTTPGGGSASSSGMWVDKWPDQKVTGSDNSLVGASAQTQPTASSAQGLGANIAVVDSQPTPVSVGGIIAEPGKPLADDAVMKKIVEALNGGARVSTTIQLPRATFGDSGDRLPVNPFKPEQLQGRPDRRAAVDFRAELERLVSAAAGWPVTVSFYSSWLNRLQGDSSAYELKMQVQRKQ